MFLIFKKRDWWLYWIGHSRPDNFYQQKRGIRKMLSGNKPDSNTHSTCMHRQLTTEYPSFLDLPSARLLDCQTGQTALWIFLLGFSYPRSRTGLCVQTRILLFSHHSSLFHTTTLYLPYLFWYVSRIGNHLHIIELRKPIGWCHDSDPNINGEYRKSQQVIHLTQNMALMQANENLSPAAPIPQPSLHNFPLSPSFQYQPLPPPSLFALAQDHATHMPSSSHIREPKITTPLSFSGKRDDTESFINGCCLYINGQKLELPDKDAKIYWILLYMQTGSAKTWCDYIVTLIYKRQQSFLISDELLKEIDQKFGDMDKRTTQSLKIRTIQQGDRSADEHIQEFEKAVLEAGYEGYPLVVEFKCLLNSGLRRRLTELWPMPMTIQQ